MRRLNCAQAAQASPADGCGHCWRGHHACKLLSALRPGALQVGTILSSQRICLLSPLFSLQASSKATLHMPESMTSCGIMVVPRLRCSLLLGNPQCRCHGCRKIDTSKDARKKEAIGYYRIESAIALFCALLINIFVVSVFARGFYGKVGALDRLRPAWKLP